MRSRQNLKVGSGTAQKCPNGGGGLATPRLPHAISTRRLQAKWNRTSAIEPTTQVQARVKARVTDDAVIRFGFDARHDSADEGENGDDGDGENADEHEDEHDGEHDEEEEYFNEMVRRFTTHTPRTLSV